MITAVPTAIPVTIPVLLIVAIPGALLLQVPPNTGFVSKVLLPTHTMGVPPIGDELTTDTVTLVLHPDGAT